MQPDQRWAGTLQKGARLSGAVEPEQTPTREQVERELSTLADRGQRASGDKAPVARLVDNILFDALSRKASDVHIHPYPVPGGGRWVAEGRLWRRKMLRGVWRG